MGMREELQAELAEAFDNELADAVHSFSGGVSLPSEQWYPVTETGGEPVVISYSGRGILDSFKVELVDGVNIKATDQNLIALTNETTGIPQIGHKITTKNLLTGQQTTYDVLKPDVDPVGAHYEIHLREV